jgi:hypothetical protein
MYKVLKEINVSISFSWSNWDTEWMREEHFQRKKINSLGCCDPKMSLFSLNSGQECKIERKLYSRVFFKCCQPGADSTNLHLVCKLHMCAEAKKWKKNLVFHPCFVDEVSCGQCRQILIWQFYLWPSIGTFKPLITANTRQLITSRTNKTQLCIWTSSSAEKFSGKLFALKFRSKFYPKTTEINLSGWQSCNW